MKTPREQLGAKVKRGFGGWYRACPKCRHEVEPCMSDWRSWDCPECGLSSEETALEDWKRERRADEIALGVFVGAIAVAMLVWVVVWSVKS